MDETVGISIPKKHSSHDQAGAAASAAPATGARKTVNPGTTTQEVRVQLRNGWLGSIALHGLVLLSLFPLFRLSVAPISQKSFHWDVTLIQSTRTADETVQQLKAAESIVASPPKQAPMPARTIRRAPPSAERIVPVEPQTAEPITPTSQPSLASSAASANEVSTTSRAEKPTPSEPQASDPSPQRTEMPANSTTTEASITQTAVATMSEGTVGSMEPAQPTIPAATRSDREVSSTARPDYGWLQQAIFRRLEELKRSSRPSLDQSQPLKVMVKAVVSREGTLLDSMVVQSSGLDRIDQEAMALVQRAFPMQLDHPLDRQQVAMRIPITYSRE